MPPNPLTPHQQEPILPLDPDNRTRLAMELNTSVIQGNTHGGMPMNSVGADLDDYDERPNMEEVGHNHDTTDDEDMSEGGAPLTAPILHAAALNAEMDLIDAEIMGSENLAALYMDTHFPSMSNSEHEYHDFDHPAGPGQAYNNVYDESDDNLATMQAEAQPVPLDGSGLPAAMSQLSQQLQHIQDGQEHMDVEVAMNDPVGGQMNNMEDHWNLSLGDFLYSWGMSAAQPEQMKRHYRGPDVPAVHRQRCLDDLEPVRSCDLRGELCDIQRIDWAELGVSRQEARVMRRRTYNNYTNVSYSRNQQHPRLYGARLDDHENFFKFRRMDFDHHIRLTHFQLRNVMACANRGHVFYAGKSRIFQWNPSSASNSIGPTSVAMDLTNPTIQSFHGLPGGVQISTLACEHNVLVAGGFCGEYALVNLMAHKDTKHTEGLITDEINSITNHVQVHLSRHSALPVAAFASNDGHFRVLDVSTNTFISKHRYGDAINCSAISPDRRLRVMVGDTSDVMITNSDTGEILQCLEGHRDFGFACDWADDGWTVATGNQDMQVKIWDARKWTSSSGASCPLATIAAEMGGVRKLRFSPVGSGKRVLLAAEPADLISVIDAQSFATKQTLSFFGEIGGVDFTNDGQDLVVANCDTMRGGLMQYERCNFASEAFHSFESRRNPRNQYNRSRSYDWNSDSEDGERPRKRSTNEGVDMGYF